MTSAVPMMECVPAGDSDERLNLRPEAAWPLSIVRHLLVCFMLVLPLLFFPVTVCVRCLWTPALSQNTLVKLSKLLLCSGDILEMRFIPHISVSTLHFYIFMTME